MPSSAMVDAACAWAVRVDTGPLPPRSTLASARRRFGGIGPRRDLAKNSGGGARAPVRVMGASGASEASLASRAAAGAAAPVPERRARWAGTPAHRRCRAARRSQRRRCRSARPGFILVVVAVGGLLEKAGAPALHQRGWQQGLRPGRGVAQTPGQALLRHMPLHLPPSAACWEVW